MTGRDPRSPRAPVAEGARKSIFAVDEERSKLSTFVWSRHTDLELIQLHRIQEPVLVHVRHFKYPPERFGTFRLEDMFSRVVERCGRVENGFLGEVEHFGNVQGETGGAFHNRFNFL
jgi:hypothetical protein